MADPVHPDEVPKEFICAICLSIPLDPLILGPCSHIFCKNCIKESLTAKKVCPVCQRGCRSNQVFSLKTKNVLANRIWSNILVKCEHVHYCGWTGSITDYQSHQQSCAVVLENTTLRTENTNFMDAVERLHRRLEVVLAEKKNLGKENERLSLDAEALAKNLQSLQTEKNNLCHEKEKLQQKLEKYEQKEEAMRNRKRKRNGLTSKVVGYFKGDVLIIE